MTIDDYIASGQAPADDQAAADAYNADLTRAPDLWATPETLISRLAKADPIGGIAAARRLFGGLDAAAKVDPVVARADARLNNSELGINLGDPSTLSMLVELVAAKAIQQVDADLVLRIVLGEPATTADIAAARVRVAEAKFVAAKTAAKASAAASLETYRTQQITAANAKVQTAKDRLDAHAAAIEAAGDADALAAIADYTPEAAD